MRHICKGNVYFAKCSGIMQQISNNEKKLPVLIIRESATNDPNCTVTVIPASGTTSISPYVDIPIIDTYGQQCEHETMRFLPEYVLTIPSSHISDFIGTLTKTEFDTIYQALTHWLFSTDDTAEQPEPQPAIMEEYAASMPKKIRCNIESFSDFSRVEKAAAYAESSYCTPARNGFPASTATIGMLRECANNFRIPCSYYNNTAEKRDRRCLTSDEISIVQGNMNDAEYQEVLQLYDNMTPFDANFICKLAPSEAISKLYSITAKSAYCIKRLSNLILAIPQEVYQSRVEHLCAELPQDDNAGDVDPEEAEPTFEDLYPQYKNKKDLQDALTRIRPFMSAKNIDKLPKSMMEDFVRLPMYLIKNAYRGSNFSNAYANMYTRCKDALLTDQNM